jgi:hypothetical protein
MDKWSQLPNKETIEKTIAALKKNNIDAYFVETAEDAKQKFFEILPEGAEVLNSSSQTLDTFGIAKEIMESGKYKAVKNELMKMDRNTQRREMQKMGSAPEWAVGSVHAVTKEGHVLIASKTGSQLPGYAYGAGHVIWVVGVHKIVDNVDDGIKRIFDHSLPLENERIKKAYGIEHSDVERILIMYAENAPGRSTVIFVNQVIGE